MVCTKCYLSWMQLFKLQYSTETTWLKYCPNMRLNLSGSGKKPSPFVIHIFFGPYKERTCTCSRNDFWRVGKGDFRVLSAAVTVKETQNRFRMTLKGGWDFSIYQQPILSLISYSELQKYVSTFLSALAKQAIKQECSETGHGSQVVLMFPPLYKRDESGSVEASCSRGCVGLQPWLLTQANLRRGTSAWLALE